MQKLPDSTKDFAAWYHEVIHQAELVDESPTKGTMVIRPYGYNIWENIQKIVDAKIKTHGVSNAYFPLLIPEAFLKKEAQHVEGFSPELAVVTHAGGKALEEPLVVRPTSETIIYHMFARWIHSWRDLPLKINQWANVVRWEMRSRPFLRTSEFLWQEGHTAHATHAEARELALTILEEYKHLAEHYLAIPVITGEKPPSERFAGADHTFTFEAMMGDGKALQMGTSHILAHSFPRAFGVSFQDKDGSMKTPYCTSWAITTRLIGALVMVHGDNNGLIIPPRIAPLVVVIVPIYRTDADKEKVLSTAHDILKRLQHNGIACRVDDDETSSPGAKFFHWELRGVPLRIELGPRDIDQQVVVLVNRAEPVKEMKKKTVALATLEKEVLQLIDHVQEQLLQRARERQQAQWFNGDDLAFFGPQLEQGNGFYQTGWCGAPACEQACKKYKATIRCVLQETTHAHCHVCKEKSVHDILIAKAY